MHMLYLYMYVAAKVVHGHDQNYIPQGIHHTCVFDMHMSRPKAPKFGMGCRYLCVYIRFEFISSNCACVHTCTRIRSCEHCYSGRSLHPGMYLCLCVCTPVCKHVCKHVCMYVCKYVLLYICMYDPHVILYVCIICMIRMYSCMYVCMYVCLYSSKYVCMYSCIHMYVLSVCVCMYSCTPVCMYSCIYVCMYSFMYLCM
jgi:hypothetical protein